MNKASCRDSDNRAQHGLEIVDLTSRITEHHYGSVMLLGNFDGLHRGHQSLVDAARGLAQRLNAPLGIMSCEPHPRQFLRPSAPPFRLTTRAGKHLTFAALGFRLLFEPLRRNASDHVPA